MNCFSEEAIQQYIDNELSEKDTSDFDEHINNCNNCSTNLYKQLYISNFVKHEIDLLIDEPTIIPNINTIIEKDRIIKKTIVRKLLYVVSAASIAFATFLFINSNQKSVSVDNNIVISNDYYYDANKSIMEQEIEITITDIK